MVISSVRQIVLGLEDFATTRGVINDLSSLYDAGLSSYGTVNLMLALETEFDVQFPDTLLTRKTFETITSIAGVVETLQRQPQASGETPQPQDAATEASADGWFFKAESGR